MHYCKSLFIVSTLPTEIHLAKNGGSETKILLIIKPTFTSL